MSRQWPLVTACFLNSYLHRTVFGCLDESLLWNRCLLHATSHWQWGYMKYLQWKTFKNNVHSNISPPMQRQKKFWDYVGKNSIDSDNISHARKSGSVMLMQASWSFWGERLCEERDGAPTCLLLAGISDASNGIALKYCCSLYLTIP